MSGRKSPVAGIKIENLVKKYGSFTAVDDISLKVKPGQIFGFLGPNGAGKTTTIKLLAGLLKPDAGNILINGYNIAKDPVNCKLHTGHIPDRPFLYEKLTGNEFLSLSPVSTIYQLQHLIKMLIGYWIYSILLIGRII